MFSKLTRAMYNMLNQAHTIRLTARATGSHIEGAWRNPGGPSEICSIKVSDIDFTNLQTLTTYPLALLSPLLSLLKHTRPTVVVLMLCKTEHLQDWRCFSISGVQHYHR